MVEMGNEVGQTILVHIIALQLLTHKPNKIILPQFLNHKATRHPNSRVLKDNIHTTHLPTTAGTLAFDGYIPPYEATLTKNLRDGGAIILAKTVLTEMANWMVLGMPNNYSAVGGYAFNPYDPRRDPRPGKTDGRGVLATGSSSSGAGTAANLWAANVGTETTVSIIGPASSADTPDRGFDCG